MLSIWWFTPSPTQNMLTPATSEVPPEADSINCKWKGIGIKVERGRNSHTMSLELISQVREVRLFLAAENVAPPIRHM